MGDVIQFGTKPETDEDEPDFFVNGCGGCGCITWYARADGEAQCAHCGELMIGEGRETWLRKAAPEDLEGAPTTQEQLAREVVDFNCPQVNLKHFLKQCEDGEPVMIAVLKKDGDLDTRTDREARDINPQWFRQRLTALWRTVLGEDPAPHD